MSEQAATDDLGDEVRRKREALGWTPEELAVYAGLSAPTVRAIETGRTRPYFRTIQKIRSALKRGEETI